MTRHFPIAASAMSLAIALATPAAAQTSAQIQATQNALRSGNLGNAVNGAINEMLMDERRNIDITTFGNGRRLYEGFIIWGGDEATSLPSNGSTIAPAKPGGPMTQADIDLAAARAAMRKELGLDENHLVGSGGADSLAGSETMAALGSALARLPSFQSMLDDPRFGDSVVDQGSGGGVTVATLLPIYAGYKPALTTVDWTSLDLYPPSGSSVATTPATPRYSPSSVGNSLSSAGNSLSSAGTSLPIDWVSLSASGNGLPLDPGAYRDPRAPLVNAASSPLTGAIAWLLGATNRLASAWSEPPTGNSDPVARGLAYAALWNAFTQAAIQRAGISADSALASQLYEVAALSQHDILRAQIALGELLQNSRDIASTNGFSDIGISGLSLAYMLRDFGIEDGDIIDVTLQQFGKTLYTGQLSLLNAGTAFKQQLRSGVAQLTIRALNEGTAPPNTAQVTIDNVVRGSADQQYSLKTGETATLRVEANAKPGGR